MSKKSREESKALGRYFAYLENTGTVVDPYVRAFIKGSYGQTTWLVDLLIERYRFGIAQLRPATVRMAYELAGGLDWLSITSACAALEVKDTGYYSYDELLDKSGSDEELVVAGHFFHELAREMLDGLSCDSNQLVAIRKLMADLDLANAEGLLVERKLRATGSMCRKLYFEKVRGFNFWEYAMGIGAVLAGASDERINLIKRIGRSIGMAYIVANDTWEFGKDDLHDFQSGKMTLPIMFALQNTCPFDRNLLRCYLGSKLSPTEQDTIRGIMVRSGAIDYGKRQAWKLCQKVPRLLCRFEDLPVKRIIISSLTMTQFNKHYDKLEQYQS